MSMERINGTMSYQCQVPQYNAVKIDIHQPKVQAPGNNDCRDSRCHEHEHGYRQEHPHGSKGNIYGQKGNNSVSMPRPSNVVVSKKEKPAKEPVIEELNEASVEEQNPGNEDSSIVTTKEPVVEEPIEQTEAEV